MRIVIVGNSAARARLRRALAGADVEILDEVSTIDAARSRGLAPDALLVAEAAPVGDGDAVPHATSDIPSEPLTPRELDVLRLLAEGLPNKAIAARLGISDQTVKFHVAAIGGKLGAINRTDAVRLAIRRGLVDI